MNGAYLKNPLCTLMGVFGSAATGLFGGWDASFLALLLFMCVDYLTGLGAAITGNSCKTKSGRLSSAIGFKGLAKKGCILLLVLVAAQLDMVLEIHYIRDGVCIAFLLNELLSILENAGLMGIPLPTVLRQAIDLLQSRSGGGDSENGG